MFPGICHCIGPPGAEPPGSEQKGAAHPDTSPKGQDGPLGLSNEPAIHGRATLQFSTQNWW